MKMLLKKSLSGLVSASSEGDKYLKKIKLNEVVSCEIKKPRNVDHHRKFFALMNHEY